MKILLTHHIRTFHNENRSCWLQSEGAYNQRLLGNLLNVYALSAIP